VIFWLIDMVIVALCIFGRPTKWPALETLGNASYSLYLAHLLPMFFMFIFWQKVMHFKAPLVFMALGFALSIATGLATFRWIERPLTRLFSRLILHRPAHPPAEPTPQPVLEPTLAKA
jgi:exopolysaccharide production protein ExoZ